MTAGKDFGGMCQGDNKMRQRGRHAMFVMPPSDIPKNILKDRTIMYAWVAVDHHPQKEDPNRIWITAGWNLINSNNPIVTGM